MIIPNSPTLINPGAIVSFEGPLVPFADSRSAEVRHHPKYGKGVFCKHPITAGEHIAAFNGRVHRGYFDDDLPQHLINHGLQFGPDLVRDSLGYARSMNHSCSPNAGVKDLFRLVAMRDIAPDEEIVWDYEMAENADWSMLCTCGESSCRRVIAAYRFLPQEFRNRYEGYISQYLLDAEIPVEPMPEELVERTFKAAN